MLPIMLAANEVTQSKSAGFFDAIFPKIADWAGVLSLLFSVGLFLFTKSIKKQVENTFRNNKKISAYSSMRQAMLDALYESRDFFISYHGCLTYNEAKPYILKISQAVSDFETYYPDLDDKGKETIKNINSYIAVEANWKHFSYLTINKDISHLISILSVGVYVL